ncbi:MAG: WxL domain-containing protein [Carnobacterium sp.]|uniref:WxL domain-containing protein n=1 Tax=Carnobacterium sp. TaxID=48221 RepID=UPI002FC9B361
MKKTTLLAGLVLSGLILTTTETCAFAAESTTTEGSINFKTGDVIGEVIKPETPNVIVPETGGSSAGPLRIQHVPDFSFGTQELAIGNQSFNPTLETYKFKDTSLQAGAVAGETYAIPHFIQVTDARGSNAGWNLTAKATTFTTKQSNDEMPNATITLQEGKLSNTTYDDTEIANRINTFKGNSNAGTGKLTIPTDGNSLLVMQTKTDTKVDTTNGTQTSLVLNDLYDKENLGYQATETNTGVQFDKTNKDIAIVTDAANAYESIITWTLTDGI